MKSVPPAFYAGDLYGELYDPDVPVARRRVIEFVPGLLLCATAALAAAWLAEHYSFPIILLGLLIGLALSFVSEVEVTAPGLDFSSRHFLRIGIVLLGAQVTFAQVGALGWLAFAGLLSVMGASFAAALLAARWTGQGREAGILAGGATAICGASAALALYGVIGSERLDQARFSVTLVGVAVASAIVMAACPALADILALSDRQAGFLIGASVHDAGQAIGGAFSYSDEAGRDGTVVKLARVAMLGPIVALVAFWLGRADVEDAKRPWHKRVAIPWFIAGFIALLAANSVLAFPEAWTQGALDASKALLLLAVIATAMRSQLRLLLEAGWSALAPVTSASVVSLLVALMVTLSF